MIKAVAFDVDGTLYPQWRINTISAVTYLQNRKLVNAYWHARRQLRRSHAGKDIGDIRRYQAQMMALDNDWDPEWIYQQVDLLIYQRWQQMFSSVKTFSKITEVLAELKQQGYLLAVMSDFPVDEKLKQLGVDGWWDVAFCSEQLNALKPSLKVFQFLQEQLDCKPGEILYVGNHYFYDIFGGHNAGFRTAHVTIWPRLNSLADFSFYSYKYFLKKLDKLQQKYCSAVC